MATNLGEVAGEGVSVADATAALAQFEDEPSIEQEEAGQAGFEEQEDPDGGEGVELEAEEVEADEAEAEYEEGEDELHVIKVDGEEQEVPYSELINGYQRQADYTRKTQEIAEQRRDIDRSKQNIQNQAVHYAQAYLTVSEQIAELAPTEDDIKRAWNSDPQGAAELKNKRDDILGKAVQARDLAVALHEQSKNQLKEQMAAAGQKLPELVPEWSDPEVRKQEVVSVAQYLVGQGMDPQDIERTANPVAWAIARKAWQFDQLQKSTGAKVTRTSVPKIRKTRAPKPRLKGTRKRAAQNKQAFDKNPSRDNAVALLAPFEE